MPLTTDFQPIARSVQGKPWFFLKGYDQAGLERLRAAGHVITAQRRVLDTNDFELLAKLTERGLRGV